jgi:hypothetical protein
MAPAKVTATWNKRAVIENCMLAVVLVRMKSRPATDAD